MISLDLMKSSEVRKAGDRSNCVCCRWYKPFNDMVEWAIKRNSNFTMSAIANMAEMWHNLRTFLFMKTLLKKVMIIY